jgi:hypothetical protein
LEEYFMDWSMEFVTINMQEMMYIEEYVSDKGFSTKHTKNMINRYIYLMAGYFLVHEPDVQEKLLSLGCKVPIQRNDKE